MALILPVFLFCCNKKFSKKPKMEILRSKIWMFCGGIASAGPGLTESEQYNFCNRIFLAEFIPVCHLADMGDAEKRD